MILREGRGAGKVRAVDLNATVLRVIGVLNETTWYRHGIRLDTDETRGYAYHFTLRMVSSGIRGSAYKGRRTPYACWHTHRDVMVGIFTLRPLASLATGVIRYADAVEFRRLFPDTYYGNVGSLAEPVNRGDACWACDMGARVYDPSVRAALEGIGATL